MVEQSLCRHGWRHGAYMDVLVASLRNHNRKQANTDPSSFILLAKNKTLYLAVCRLQTPVGAPAVSGKRLPVRVWHRLRWRNGCFAWLAHRPRLPASAA